VGDLECLKQQAGSEIFGRMERAFNRDGEIVEVDEELFREMGEAKDNLGAMLNRAPNTIARLSTLSGICDNDRIGFGAAQARIRLETARIRFQKGMSPMHTILNILLLSAAVFIVAALMPTIKIKNYWTALWVAVVYSLVNFFIGWLLRLFALPFIVLTLGLFTFVVNAALLWITDKFIDDFEISGFFSTLIAAFLITIINGGLRWMLVSLGIG